MLESIGILAGNLKAAAEMTKAMIDLRDAAVLNSKVIELQGIILSAQSSAMAAQSDQFTLLNRVRELEEEMARAKAWDAEAEKYELKEIYTGVVAYVPKPDTEEAKAPHYLCANCYANKRKAFLQFSVTMPLGDVYKCTGCDSQAVFRHGSSPQRKVIRG